MPAQRRRHPTIGTHPQRLVTAIVAGPAHASAPGNMRLDVSDAAAVGARLARVVFGVIATLADRAMLLHERCDCYPPTFGALMSRTIGPVIAGGADGANVVDHRVDKLHLVTCHALNPRLEVVCVARAAHRSYPRDYGTHARSLTAAIAGPPRAVVTRVAGLTDWTCPRDKGMCCCIPPASNAFVPRRVMTAVAAVADRLLTVESEHRGSDVTAVATRLKRSVVAAPPNHQAVVPLVGDVPMIPTDIARTNPPAPTLCGAIGAQADVSNNLVSFVALGCQICNAPLVAALALLLFVALAGPHPVSGLAPAHALLDPTNGARDGVNRHYALLT